MNNVYSCAYVAVLFRVHEFFGMRSIEEKLMHAVNSVYSMDKANIRKRFFHIFAGESPKVVYKNSIIRIQKCSGRNERMIIPKGVRDALEVELGNSVRCEIRKVKT
jgi:hypothetical protein